MSGLKKIKRSKEVYAQILKPKIAEKAYLRICQKSLKALKLNIRSVSSETRWLDYFSTFGRLQQ